MSFHLLRRNLKTLLTTSSKKTTFTTFTTSRRVGIAAAALLFGAGAVLAASTVRDRRLFLHHQTAHASSSVAGNNNSSNATTHKTKSSTNTPSNAPQAGDSNFDEYWRARAGAHRDDLPLYTVKDLVAHNSPETRIWVSYKGGIYDITEWVCILYLCALLVRERHVFLNVFFCF